MKYDLIKWKKTKLFKINDFLSLKFRRNKTFIYVRNKKFIHCKYLLLNVPIHKFENYNELNSIDEAIEKLDKSLEREFEKIISIPPETEFMGHCSNLQAWAENYYDTRLLHSNLSFQLLKKLTEAGDPQAKIVFREEIAKRFEESNFSVATYLVKENYLKFLNDEELDFVIQNLKNLFKDNPGKMIPLLKELVNVDLIPIKHFLNEVLSDLYYSGDKDLYMTHLRVLYLNKILPSNDFTISNSTEKYNLS